MKRLKVEIIKQKDDKKKADSKTEVNENLRKLLWTNISGRIQNGKTEGTKLEVGIGGERWMKTEFVTKLIEEKYII